MRQGKHSIPPGDHTSMHWSSEGSLRFSILFPGRSSNESRSNLRSPAPAVRKIRAPEAKDDKFKKLEYIADITIEIDEVTKARYCLNTNGLYDQKQSLQNNSICILDHILDDFSIHNERSICFIIHHFSRRKWT